MGPEDPLGEKNSRISLEAWKAATTATRRPLPSLGRL